MPYDEEDDFYSIFKKNPYLTPPFVGPGQSRTAGTFPGPTGPPGPQLPGPGIGSARMPPLNAPNVQPTFGQRLGQGMQNPDFLTAIAQILMAQKGGKYGGYAALAGGETAAAIKERQRQEDLDRQAKLQREIENRREVDKMQMEAAKIKNEQQRYEYLRRKDEELATSRVRDDARETLKMASAQGLDISVPDFQDLREKAGWGNVNMAGPKYVVSLKTGHIVKYRPNSQYDDPAKFTRPDVKAIAEENQKAELQRLKDEREAKAKKPTAPGTARTAKGVMQWNPDTGRYDIKTGDLPPSTAQPRQPTQFDIWHSAKRKELGRELTSKELLEWKEPDELVSTRRQQQIEKAERDELKAILGSDVDALTPNEYLEDLEKLRKYKASKQSPKIIEEGGILGFGKKKRLADPDSSGADSLYQKYGIPVPK